MLFFKTQLFNFSGFFRYIYAICWILCTHYTICSKGSARNKGENIGGNSGYHQFLTGNFTM